MRHANRVIVMGFVFALMIGVTAPAVADDGTVSSPKRCHNPNPPPPTPPGDWPRAELCQVEDDGQPNPTSDPQRPTPGYVPQSTSDLTTLVNTIALTLYLMNPAAPAPPSILLGPLPPTLP
jgi:hypothetical protein